MIANWNYDHAPVFFLMKVLEQSKSGGFVRNDCSCINKKKCFTAKNIQIKLSLQDRNYWSTCSFQLKKNIHNIRSEPSAIFLDVIVATISSENWTCKTVCMCVQRTHLHIIYWIYLTFIPPSILTDSKEKGSRA